MELCDRKKQILQAIVDEYVETAEPIGSRTIANKNGINLSSATIRNEMAGLEELGFLDKPHTSAGRVPSVLGYRFYVNSLMHKRYLTYEESERLHYAMRIRLREVDEIIAETSKIVSKLMDYTVIVTAPKPQKLTIRSIKLLPIGGQQLLFAIITNAESVKNIGIEIPYKLSDEYVYFCSRVLSEKLVGKSPYDITNEQLIFIKTSFEKSPGLFKIIISYLFEWFDRACKGSVYAGGVFNMFNHPEYRDINRAREVIKFLDNKENMKNIVEDGNNVKKVKIKIGDENEAEELRDCSVVIANYNALDNMHGSIGVIGPMRMDYSKVVSSLEVVTEKLNKLIYKMYIEE